MAVGTTGIYKAPTDMTANQQVLARVGPGTESAAIVTGVNADATLFSLRVFPDQQEDFSIKGIGTVDDPIMGSFAAGVAEAPVGGETSTQRKAREATEKKRKEEESKRATAQTSQKRGG